MAGPKIVKRYANRKLYDTERSCYVTLDDIAQMIKAGEEVKVVDNKSGEDLTSVTLAQIIFEAEKKSGLMPIGLLRDLIRNGGDSISEFARERVDAVQAKAQDIREQAQKLKTDFEERLDKVIHSKKDGKADVSSGAVADAPTSAAEESHGTRQLRVLKELSELVESSQRTFEEVQKSIEERIRGGVGTVSRLPNLGEEMEEMRKRLEALENRLEHID